MLDSAYTSVNDLLLQPAVHVVYEWWRDVGMVFLGICYVFSVSLFGALNGMKHQLVICARRTYGGHSRWRVKLQRVYKEDRDGGGHCLYIIAGHSSGKTSDGCPRLREVE